MFRWKNSESFERTISTRSQGKVSSDGGLLYINRKGFPSITVQVVCNAELKIMDIVTRWQDSVYDSRIFRECQLKQRCLVNP
ncbi:unnamed protein product [Leptosia nina]|uniref:DDE Tnp4 domain-containing protein n=1 Tax=Leptosia nina TaxID=320188 RepID=A0AAV1IT94_9NEOP